MFPKFKTKRIVKLNSKVSEKQLNETINNYDNSRNIVKKQNPIFRLLKLLIWIILIIWIVIYNSYSNFKTNILIKESSIIKISQGDTSKDLAEKLNLNKIYLKFYLTNNNPDLKLLVGNFKIEKDSSIIQILESLKNPIIENQINITLLEWWNIFDIDEYLTNKKLINKWEYIDYAQNTEKIKKLSKFFPFINWVSTLEWFLYPDTYNVISNNFKINVFVIKQLENFENKVYNKILSNLDNKEIIELINLASIVEKEEKNKIEKPVVAWILKKRLDSWWMIWADITVCYPHKLTANECKMVITKYINQRNDYNTRKKAWLPKTPIWNPSFETINATLNFKATNYWFYLHDIKTGKIYYAKSNAEHTKNKRLYLR